MGINSKQDQRVTHFFQDTWNGEKYHKNSDQQKRVADQLIAQYSFNDYDRILDVGCGDGKITHKIAENVPNCHVIGIDPSKSMIDFACSRFGAPNLEFQIGKASELSYENQFNVITAFSCLHWEPNQKESLLCFRKALKIGGAILLAIPGPDPTLRLVLKKVCELPKWLQFFKDFESPGRIWTSNEYAQFLLETEFVIRKVEVVNRTHLFQNEVIYKEFMAAMLPHMSRLLKDHHDDFLNDILCYIKKEQVMNEYGQIKFENRVLEIIAYKNL